MINPVINATLEWTSNEIPARSYITLDIIWNPTVVISSREVIQFTDNRNFRKDVVVIMKSIDKTQQLKNAIKKTSHTVEHKTITKKLTLKSPSPRSKMHRNRLGAINATSSMSNRTTIKKDSINRIGMKRVLALNSQQTSPVPSITVFDEINNVLYTSDKENLNPSSSPSKNMSCAFDSLIFTPVGKTKVKSSNVDYLASLPTPNSSVKNNNQSIYVRNGNEQMSPMQFKSKLNETETIMSTPHITVHSRTTTFDNFQTPISQNEVHDQFAIQKTPTFHIEHTFNITNVPTPGFEPVPKLNEGIQSRKLIMEMQGHSPRMETIAENTELLVNRTQTISSPITIQHLSVIKEENSKVELSETYVKQSDHHLTYNIDEQNAKENLVRDVRLVGTPLRKKFQSMKELNDSQSNLSLEQKILKSNQGSMPNLHKMEAVKSIESNRYYYQSIEKDLQQAVGNNTTNQHVDDDFENLGDTSICSIKSTVSAFHEHEILAQSSRFNLNEVGRNNKLPSGNLQHININKTPKKQILNDRNIKIQPNKHLSMSSPSINKTTASSKLSQSTRDISHSLAEIKKRPTTFLYSVESSPSLNKRNRDDKSFSSNKSSPPKRVCMENDLPKSTKGQSVRTKTWSGTMPKKFRVPNVPPQRLQFKRTEEERVILFDPELHLRGENFSIFFFEYVLNDMIPGITSKLSTLHV